MKRAKLPNFLAAC